MNWLEFALKMYLSVSSRDGHDIILYLSWFYCASIDKHQSLFVYLQWLEGVLMHINDSVCVYVCVCVCVCLCVHM